MRVLRDELMYSAALCTLSTVARSLVGAMFALAALLDAGEGARTFRISVMKMDRREAKSRPRHVEGFSHTRARRARWSAAEIRDA